MQNPGAVAGLCCLCLFKWYVAVATYYVDLLGCADNCPAIRANVLDAAVPAGLAATLDRRGGFFSAFILVPFDLDLKQRLPAGGNILHARLLGQPCRRFLGERPPKI